MQVARQVNKGLRIACSFALASTMVVAPAGVQAAFADVGSKTLTISTEAQLRELSAAVNAGTTYEGYTVMLTSNIDLSGIFTPIGTVEHPFCGSFGGYTADGSAARVRTISGLKVEGDDYLGLFGFVGAGGSISDITLEDVTITASSSAKIVKCVGAVAGYCYGSITNCSTEGASAVSATSTMTVTSDDAHRVQYTPEQRPADGITNYGFAIEYVGGIAGYCAGSVTDCENAAKVYVEARQAPDGSYSSLAQSVGGIVGQVGGYVTRVDYVEEDGSRYVPSYPDGKGSYSTKTDGVSVVSGCVNTATVETLVDSEAGLDRFGNTTSAVVMNVAGIAGYSMANIDNCLNSVAYSYETRQNEQTTPENVMWPTSGILSVSGDSVGGIVGSLRGVSFSGSSSAKCDAGCYDGAEGPELAVSNCINDAGIIGRHAIGGIAGAGGTYTTITLSANVNENANILGIRWNKPFLGGIAGQMYGNIKLCYNRSSVESYTHAGYYVAGIVGNTCRYEKSAGYDVDSPTATIDGCFFSGYVVSAGQSDINGYNRASIVGNNEGLVQNCYTTSDMQVCATNEGTVDTTAVNNLTSKQLQSKEYVAKLNKSVMAAGYAAGNYFQASAHEDASDAEAFPVLHSATFTDEGSVVYGAQGDDVFAAPQELSASNASVSGTGTAHYAAQGNPMPQLSVKYNGSDLVQGADYYAIADDAALDASGKCKDVADLQGTTLKADIAGIGGYTGTVALQAPYTMAKGDFSTCTPTIAAKTFNYYSQWPATPTDEDNSEVIIRDASGARIAAADFTMQADPGNCVTRKTTVYQGRTYEGYKVEFTATSTSNYSGTCVGFMAINKAWLFSENNKFDGLTYDGVDYYWQRGSWMGATDSYLYTLDKDGNQVKGMSVAYTGESIKPTIIEGFSYKDGKGEYQALVEGKDYKIVYGDPGDTSDLISEDTAEPNTNVTSDEPGKRACVTIRYFKKANSCNFQNYYNFYFDIVPGDIADFDVAVSGEYTGKTPKVAVTNSNGTVIGSENYTVTCSSLKAGAKCKVTIKGKGNLTGKVTKTVTLTKVNVGKVAKVATVKVAKKKATVSWKKAANANGYRVAYRAAGANKWSYASTASTKLTLKKLKSGKKYQIKVQAYKKVGALKVYGAWSKVTTSKKVK